MDTVDKTPFRKPGEMALIAIKQQQSKQSKAVQVFKRPQLPVVKKNKKVILSEESYMKVS
jgi:hypothetical protein